MDSALDPYKWNYGVKGYAHMEDLGLFTQQQRPLVFRRNKGHFFSTPEHTIPPPLGA